MGRKRREIIIETERVLLISSRSDNAILWCEPCGQRVLMLTIEEASAIMSVSVDDILRKIEGRRLHWVRTPGGRLRICPNSLLK